MKKNLFNLRIMSFLTALLFTVGACKKECNQCIVPQADLVKTITFNLNDQSIGKDFQIYQMKSKNGYNREGLFREGKIENYLFDFIKAYCFSKGLPVDDQTMSFVLYCNELVSNSFTVKDENIQGISVFCIEK
ncbi:MAG: hypothetical protein LBU51_08710 [Bacteroidales bacterium]|jgi:hypothetical protein|nr:hypothetical protein [Bacteroidales bacterium]